MHKITGNYRTCALVLCTALNYTTDVQCLMNNLLPDPVESGLQRALSLVS